MPSTASFPIDIEPASAVTSPSLTTSNGTSCHAPNVEEDILHAALNRSCGTPRKSEPDLHLVVHVDAGGAAADCVDARQVRGGPVSDR